MGITTTKATKNRFRSFTLFSAIGSSTTAMLMLSSHSFAAEWKFTPTLELKETYTDNVRLTKTNQESDFITEVNPGITVTGLGPHLEFDGRYVMQNLVYANEGSSNTTNHELYANGNAELWEHRLFVDASASMDQESISSFGPQSRDNTNITNNQTTVETYKISPYLRHHFKNFADSETRFTHDSVSTTDSGGSVESGLSDSTSNSILLSLTSGKNFGTMTWGLKYNKQRIDFDSGQNVEEVDYGGNIRYRLTRELSLIVNGGYERYDYDSITGESAGSYWRGGFDWTPSRRTSIEAQAGKRYTGDSYYLKASHRSRRTAFNMSYSEDITTTRDEFLVPARIDTAAFLDQLWTSLYPDPIQRQQVIAAFIRENGLPTSLAEPVNFLTNRFFLEKRFMASVSFSGEKNTAILSLYDVRREAQTAQTADNPLVGDLFTNDDTKQQGMLAHLQRKISPQTNANLSVELIKTKGLTTGIEDEEKTLRLSINKEFLSDVRGELEFRRTDLKSNEQGSGYDENALKCSVYISF